jgi:hypothetical protein
MVERYKETGFRNVKIARVLVVDEVRLRGAGGRVFASADSFIDKEPCNGDEFSVIAWNKMRKEAGLKRLEAISP